jgi:hypothetical protein
LKYFCRVDIISIATPAWSTFVVVVKDCYIHSLKIGSLIFSTISFVILKANAPQSARWVAGVIVVDAFVAKNELEVLLSLVGDEHLSQLLGMGIDTQVELGEDAEPISSGRISRCWCSL